MTALYRSVSLRRAESIALTQLAPLALMRRAAGALADACASEARRHAPGLPIVALVGPGNNGGDALLAALNLRERGFDARAVLLDAEAPRADDARAARAEAQTANLPIMTDLLQPDATAGALFIDGLFGIGLARPITGRAAEWVSALNAAGARVISADLPSGIDADTGAIVGGRGALAVRAIRTVTFLGDKPGLRTGAGIAHAGVVQVEPLGIEPAGRDGTLVGISQAVRLAAGLARQRDSHKGLHGHVAVLGGSRGMRGAAMLAALGAQRGGAGKVSIGSPDGWHPSAEMQPQLMSLSRIAPLPAYLDTIVAGCGLGRGPRALAAIESLLRSPDRALVLDADALNLIAGRPGLPQALCKRAVPAVLTPHPLEAARLLKIDTGRVQADRIAAACRLARQTGSVVLLKGAGSVCADSAGNWAIIDAGSPALATAGTGDVLAGVIGALLAQGFTPAAAACLGAWVHGRAGERWAARNGGEVGLSAAELPDVIREVLNRVIAGCDDSRSEFHSPSP